MGGAEVSGTGISAIAQGPTKLGPIAPKVRGFFCWPWLLIENSKVLFFANIIFYLKIRGIKFLKCNSMNYYTTRRTSNSRMAWIIQATFFLPFWKSFKNSNVNLFCFFLPRFINYFQLFFCHDLKFFRNFLAITENKNLFNNFRIFSITNETRWWRYYVFLSFQRTQSSSPWLPNGRGVKSPWAGNFFRLIREF